MRNFYIILTILSGAYLVIQTVAWIFFGRRFFPDAGELFENKTDKNLWQTVFPKDMLRLIIVIFVGSVVGFLTDTAGLIGWITLPIGALAGIAVNFMISTIWEPLYDKHHKSAEPSDTELEGLSAFVAEDIDEDNFGVIKVKHGTKSYLMRAVTANGRTLPKGTAVIVIYAQDSCCFVESEEHFYDVLFDESEETETAETAEAGKQPEKKRDGFEKGKSSRKKGKKKNINVDM